MTSLNNSKQRDTFFASKEKSFIVLSHGLNFISVLCTAFTLADPESVKRYWWLSRIFFMLLGSTSVKSSCKTLVKLKSHLRRWKKWPQQLFTQKGSLRHQRLSTFNKAFSSLNCKQMHFLLTFLVLSSLQEFYVFSNFNKYFFF